MGWQPHLGRARPDLRRGWCADAELGSNIANQQDQPLALIPVEAIKCTLEQFEQEAADAGAADRLSYDVIGQAPGQPPRDLFGVVVNALETPKQQQASANWFALRDIMLTDPALGQT